MTSTNSYQSLRQKAEADRKEIFDKAIARNATARKNARMRDVTTAKICRNCNSNFVSEGKAFCDSARCNSVRVHSASRVRPLSYFQQFQIWFTRLHTNRQNLLGLGIALMVFAVLGLVFGFGGR